MYHLLSRRDEIDASHYPVFHQMDGVKLFDNITSKYENDPNDPAIM